MTWTVKHRGEGVNLEKGIPAGAFLGLSGVKDEHSLFRAFVSHIPRAELRKGYVGAGGLWEAVAFYQRCCVQRGDKDVLRVNKVLLIRSGLVLLLVLGNWPLAPVSFSPRQLP